MTDSDSNLPTINRHAVIVWRSKVFIEWARVTPDEAPEEQLAHMREEPTVYLIPESESMDGPNRFLKRHYDRIFQNELQGWCTDPPTWPQNRTYAEFRKWFKVEVASMVMDLDDDILEGG
jgi:hypothetical protein